MRKLSLFIAMSLDGYIAKPNDDLDFLSIVQKDGEDYGYQRFISTVDTVILGRKTYDWVIRHAEFPHTDKATYVISKTPRSDVGKISFYTGNLEQLVNKLKHEPGKGIFCDGGSEIINQLMQADLIDEYIISVVPVLVGEGTRLFKDGRPEHRLQFLSSTSFDSGLTQLRYERITDQSSPTTTLQAL
jgi:dihydrofolate reductase